MSAVNTVEETYRGDALGEPLVARRYVHGVDAQCLGTAAVSPGVVNEQRLFGTYACLVEHALEDVLVGLYGVHGTRQEYALYELWQPAVLRHLPV